MSDDPAANLDPGTPPADPVPGNDPAPNDPPPVDPPSDPAPEDWRAGIEDKKLREFADRFTSPADAAKVAFEFRQKLSNAVSIPGKNASEDDIKAFRQKLGVPDSVDGYNYSLPEDVSDDLKADISGLVEKLHAAGALPSTVEAAVNARVEAVQAGVEAERQRVEAALAKADAELKKEWGKDYETNTKYAQRGAKQFGDDAFVQFVEKAEVDGVPLHNHPMFLKVFAAIGRRMSEGGLHQSMSDDDKAGVQQQIDDLTKKAYDALNSGNRSEANSLYAKRDKLSKEYYGSEQA